MVEPLCGHAVFVFTVRVRDSVRVHNSVNEYGLSDYQFRVKAPWLIYLVDFDYGCGSGHRHGGVPVTLRPLIDQVAQRIGGSGAQQGETGLEGRVEYVVTPGDAPHLPAFGESGADSGGQEDAAQPRPAGPEPFRKYSGGNDLYFEMPGFPALLDRAFAPRPFVPWPFVPFRERHRRYQTRDESRFDQVGDTAAPLAMGPCALADAGQAFTSAPQQGPDQ